MRIYEVDADPDHADGPVLRHPDGPSAGRHLRIDLLHRLRRLPVPRAVPDEEAAVEHPAGQLDVRAARRRHVHVLVRRVPLATTRRSTRSTGRCRPTSRSSASGAGPSSSSASPWSWSATVFFVINIFKTITYTPAGWGKQPAGALLASALGLSGLQAFFTQEEDGAPGLAAGRGHRARHGGHRAQRRHHPVHRRADPGLHGRRALRHDLKHSAVDALLYKNWFWWGLDLIADGLVLIFVAGTWYLLATLITGKKLFMENIARPRCSSSWSCRGPCGRTT